MQEHVMQAIYEHARSVYPNESCGFVVLSGRKVRYLPCDNVADSPMEGLLLLRRTTRAEACGEIIRIIHSHPDVPNVVPSELDRVPVRSFGYCLGHFVLA